eukprot:CAMPEP_0113444728 /NCGR_PEP_ID=MMETSP0014_2-20120614/2818_1 /TAXON_ID=2857 /ORGANISM="Nitzschia sp." /LENGTH=687 /DNA_ID=CAMNT_0000335753 /DNA_START=431 /DNA_END=2494 /DNA_ORIENTATION=+ /assembly_acc=CAM_ASM_000159
MRKFMGSILVLLLAVSAKLTSGQQSQVSIDFFQMNNIPLPNNMEFNELQRMVAPGLQQSLQVAIDAYTANMPAARMNPLVGTSTLLEDLCAKVVDIQSMDVYVIQLGCGAQARRHLVQLPEQVMKELHNRGLQTANEVISFLLLLIDQLLQAFCCFCFLFETQSPSECICECISNPVPVPTQVPAMVPFDFPSFEPILPSFLPGPSEPPSPAPVTPEPTPEPTTAEPTAAPTARPTSEPTPAPVSPAPTGEPTARPTSDPTAAPTPAACPICGFFGGTIRFPTEIIDLMNATCGTVDQMGMSNQIESTALCDVLQAEPIAIETCGCTGAITPEPTLFPTQRPTPLPTPSPTTAVPTDVPTVRPTPEPTPVPTNPAPTAQPTPGFTASPTRQPTHAPTLGPDEQPALRPTPEPTVFPTRGPTPDPTGAPTNAPCRVCGILGGEITEPNAIVNMDMFSSMSCSEIDHLGKTNGIPAAQCSVIQTAVARDTCRCSGGFTPEPTVQPTIRPTPEPTPLPTRRDITVPTPGAATPRPTPFVFPTPGAGTPSPNGLPSAYGGSSKSGKGKSSSGKGKSSSGKGKSSSGKGKSSRVDFPTPTPTLATSSSESATSGNNVPVWTIPAVFAGTVVLVLVIIAVRRRRPDNSPPPPRPSSSRSRGRSSSRSRGRNSTRVEMDGTTHRSSSRRRSSRG